MEKVSEPDTIMMSETLLRVEETASVEAVARVAGRVDVSTVTETLEEIITQVLISSQANVSRHACNELIAGGAALPGTRTENGVLIVPVFEERLVMEKRLYLVEEIHIQIMETEEAVSVPVTLRKQRVEIVRTDPEAGDL